VSGPDRAAALAAWRSYAGAPLGTRLFLAARLSLVPLGAMDRELRDLKGRVLSLGCGHGIVERYLAELNPDVVVDGYELDDARVRVACRTADAAPRVTVACADVTRLPDLATHDAALAIDVLHHVSPDAHVAIAAALHRCVRAGGTLLVKDIDTRPRWKHRWNELHDRVVAGPDPVHCRSANEMAEVVEAAGFDVVEIRLLHRYGPYPHYLVHARRGQ
jgi:cyclopropane fatty-acyl-phospholipid synthase-like methyltransferase